MGNDSPPRLSPISRITIPKRFLKHEMRLLHTLQHILVICNTLVHTRIARILLRYFPRCGIDRIEGEEYLGATGLHLAIAYGNDDIAEIIVKQKGLNINERALGTFFLPRDQGGDSIGNN